MSSSTTEPEGRKETSPAQTHAQQGSQFETPEETSPFQMSATEKQAALQKLAASDFAVGVRTRFRKNQALCSMKSRNRCRICGKLSYKNIIRQLCDKHNGGSRSFEARIAPICNQLRKQLYSDVMEQNDGDDPLGLKSPEGRWNSRREWWWEMTKAFFMECDQSMSWQAIDLHEKIGKMTEVEFFDELRFDTGSTYNNIPHVAFLITTKHDGRWVYDPTGVLFGPDWGMLVP